MQDENLTMRFETWKDVPGFKNYMVSDLGRVMNKKTSQIKSQRLKYSRNCGKVYLCVDLFENNIRTTKSVHRLVAEVFIPNLENKPTVDHINRDKKDNRVENLRWATYEENNNNRGGKHGRK